MRRFVITSAVVLSACGISRPNAPSISIPHRENSVCLVQVHIIPEIRGHGYTWVQAGTMGSCGDGPKWAIEPTGAALMPWTDPTIVYIGGQNGIYRVTAKYDNGVGQVDISIEH